METHRITREIGIDAGHRVPDHGSKCRNIHGHRYRVLATCEGPLARVGEQTGMVLDFGFLKEEMMTQIDAPCDHGMIMAASDTLTRGMFSVGPTAIIAQDIAETGWCLYQNRDGLKCYIVPFVPTAENLARHWFARLEPRVRDRSAGVARLVDITVWETPNCCASYAP